MPVACFLGRGKVLWFTDRTRYGCGPRTTIVAEVFESAISKVCKGYKKVQHLPVLDFFDLVLGLEK